MISEISLFEKGIKPALLTVRSVLEKNNIDTEKYYYVEHLNGSILLAHNPIPLFNNKGDLGKFLGYYPKSCDLFKPGVHKEVNECIEFGGICFNTQGLYNEALEWCIEQYKDKILKHYKKFQYFKYYVILRDGKTSLRQEKINYISY
jgi:hypothetical protein